MDSSIALLIGGAILLVIVAGALTLYANSRGSAFEKEGVQTDAEITNLRTQNVRGTFSNSTAYYVDYTYFTMYGQEKLRQGGHHQIGGGTYASLKVGDMIQIMVLPAHPDVSRPVSQYLDPAIERSNAIGCLWYALGVAAVLIVVSMIYLAQNKVTTGTGTNVVSTVRGGFLQEIHAAVDSRLAGWQASATKRPTRLSASDAGFGPGTEIREVFYGLCSVQGASHFYLIVFDNIIPGEQTDPTWMGEAYTYAPGVTNLEDCLPEGWRTIGGDKPVEGDWHVAYLVLPAQTPFYKLTAQPQDSR